MSTHLHRIRLLPSWELALLIKRQCPILLICETESGVPETSSDSCSLSLDAAGRNNGQVALTVSGASASVRFVVSDSTEDS